MRQNWRELLFLHWAFAPELIRPLIPRELELDLFEGKAYVGLVPFTMTGVRPTGLPAIAGLSSFHETNVRTYVHVDGRDPGVWFFSLDAANTIAVRLARGLFHLPYHRARMFLERERPGPSDQPSPILYAGVRRWPAPLPASYLIRGQVSGPVRPAVPGTLEHFLAEALSALHPVSGPPLPGASPPRALPAPAGNGPLPGREPPGRRRARTPLNTTFGALRRRCRRRSLRSPPAVRNQIPRTSRSG